MTFFCATEDELSKAVIERLIHEITGKNCNPLDKKAPGGKDHIRGNLPKYVDLAKREGVIVLTDLDNSNTCAPSLRKNWLGRHKLSSKSLPACFLLCIAVREVEAWLLADRRHFAYYLGISYSLIEPDVESLPQPKEYLLQLCAKKAPSKMRKALLPDSGKNAKIGLGYNRTLCKFVRECWDPEAAASNSRSLTRAIERIQQWQSLP